MYYVHVSYACMIYIGSNHERMAKETERFMSFKQQCLYEKKKEPNGDGVLIFDEVKVISRLIWNSRSQKIIGLAMSPTEMSSLHDAYQLVDETSATKQTYSNFYGEILRVVLMLLVHTLLAVPSWKGLLWLVFSKLSEYFIYINSLQ